MKSKTARIAGVLLCSSLFGNAATISLFTGGDVGEGIDFSGNVIYALAPAAGTNGGTAGPFAVSGLSFQDTFSGGALIPNVGVSYAAIDPFGTTPNYGATANDDNLESVMRAVAHSNVSFSFTSLAANQLFRVQVLLSENSLSTVRRSTYQLFSGDGSGAPVDQVVNIDIFALQGGTLANGVVVTLEAMSDSQGRLTLKAPTSTDPTPGIDNNSIVNGLILTQVPEPSIALLGGLGLLGLLRRRRI